MILVPDEETAKKVLADPRSRGLENVGFRDLVTQYSIDTDTKERGGDLRFFDERNRELPAELVTAAFKLANIGDVSEPVKTKHGLAILKLTGQRRALTRTLAEVSQQIRAKLFRERRQKLMDDFERSLRQKSKVSVHEDKLAEVRVDLSKEIGAPEDLAPPEGLLAAIIHRSKMRPKLRRCAQEPRSPHLPPSPHRPNIGRHVTTTADIGRQATLLDQLR
jgi:hypothetical protein